MALGIMLLIYGSVEFGFTYPAYVELQDQYANLPSCDPSSPAYAPCIAARTALSHGIERLRFTLLIRLLIMTAGATSIVLAWGETRGRRGPQNV